MNLEKKTAKSMNIGIFSGLLKVIIPPGQYKMSKRVQTADRLPWMLRMYTRGDDAKLLQQFQYVAQDISLETLKNATAEALILYDEIDRFTPRPDAKVARSHDGGHRSFYGKPEVTVYGSTRETHRVLSFARSV